MNSPSPTPSSALTERSFTGSGPGSTPFGMTTTFSGAKPFCMRTSRPSLQTAMAQWSRGVSARLIMRQSPPRTEREVVREDHLRRGIVPQREQGHDVFGRILGVDDVDGVLAAVFRKFPRR